ncbi:hypothetical protein B0H10DRAFT_1306727 [Mycena sp. CBHHK59/15]|nr:hypothetical protein B0H10DRAFT_1306727 [Mycena sp. CBHHK59/15]
MNQRKERTKARARPLALTISYWDLSEPILLHPKSSTMQSDSLVPGRELTYDDDPICGQTPRPLPPLSCRITIQSGKAPQPVSPTTDGLYKFAGILSAARRVTGFWGLLAIIKGLSALERHKPESRLILNLQRLQGLSMLVFYPLEYVSFFSAPFAPLLRISPAAAMRPSCGASAHGASTWPSRSWSCAPNGEAWCRKNA